MSLLGMVARLTEARAQFVVIGGLAARAHGSPRITEDLDVCYNPTPDNIRVLAQVLAGWKAYLRGVERGLPWVMDERSFRTTPIMTLTTDQGDIDVMDRVQGVGEFAEVWQNSSELAFEGLRFRVLDLAALVKAKKATRRAKDMSQLPELEALLALRNKKGRKL